MPPTLNITSLSQNTPASTTLLPFYEATQENFALPAVGSETTLKVSDATRYAIGIYVWVRSAGWLEVTGLPDATHLYVKNNGTTGNEVPGTVAPVGSPIVASAPPTAVAAGAATLYDTLAQAFTVPAGATPAYLYLSTGGWPIVNMYLFVHDTGWFKIMAYDSTSKRCTVINADDQNAPAGTSAAADTPVYPDYPRTESLGGTYLQRSAAASFWGAVLDGKAQIPLVPGITSPKIARGQHTTVAASDTLVTGLATVVAIIVDLEDDPVDTCQFASAAIGDQAGAPAAGSVYIKTWMITSDADSTLKVATTFGKKVNWLAIGT